MRLSGYSVVLLVCLSTFASADLKIKTRTTVMGHSTESTVYIKGSRERTESSFGGHVGSVSILQCDQKRMVTVMGDHCSVMSFGGNEASCAAMPDMRGMSREMAESEAPPRKGGVVTITRTSTDTGERQDMFGYKARHIKSTLTMEASPDACNRSNMKMEMDGWYADLAGFSCGEESYRALACGGMGGKHGCNDRVVMKGGGGAALGYPLKQTTTMTTGQGTFTMVTEVVELTNTTLDAPLFDAPPGCKVSDTASTTETAPPSGTAPATTPSSAAAAPQPAAPPVPAAPPKAAGTIRVGVVEIKDATGQSLPTDNLQLDLMNEFSRHQLDAVTLSQGTDQAVEAEARAKQCDYIVYTVPTALKDPGTGGLPAASLPKGTSLDPAQYQALTLITLYKVGKPTPELKEVPVAAQADRFGVDAVSATFTQESDRVAQQIADDAHLKATPKTSKPAAARSKTSGKSQ